MLGLQTALLKVLGRWKGDAWRLAPCQYQDANMIRSSNGNRRPSSREQLRMLGFVSKHLDGKLKLTEDVKQQLIGNSWAAVTVARLLSACLLWSCDLCHELWEGWKEETRCCQQLQAASRQISFNTEGSSPCVLGSFLHAAKAPSAKAASFISSLPTSWTDEQLLAHLISQNVTHRGSDVRLDMQAPLMASDFCRRSTDPAMRNWKAVMSHK